MPPENATQTLLTILRQSAIPVIKKVDFLEHMHVMPAVSAGGCIFPLLNMMYVLSLSGWTHSEAIVPNSKRNEMGRREGGVPSGFNKWPGIYRGTAGLTKGG